MKKIILTRNNETIIEKCITSLSKIDGDIVVGDLESSDKTIEILNYLKIKPIQLKWTSSYSNGWNQLLELIDDWVFLINPNEEISWAENVSLEKETSYCVDLIANGWIYQSTRIWHTEQNLHMINPVFEHCNRTSTNLYPAILSVGNGRKSSEILSIIEEWKKNFPTDYEVSYYEALANMGSNNINKFITCANEFLFRQKVINDSVVLIWIYMASLHLIKKDYDKVNYFISLIISERPWIAEAWCMAGNVAREKEQIGRASILYRLAIACGKKRPRSEQLPMNIKSYKEEPENFLREFDFMLANI